jgi:hypothetical protein
MKIESIICVKDIKGCTKMPEMPSLIVQMGIAAACGLYLLAFFFLSQRDLMPGLCLMAAGGGVCSVSLARLRQR